MRIKIKEINYEKEPELDAEFISILFSRALRSLPIQGPNQIISRQKITHVTKGPRITASTQRAILAEIHNNSNKLWGNYLAASE